MPSVRTEVTEIVTGLATLEYATAVDAIEARPAAVKNVSEDTWEILEAAADDHEYVADVAAAWANGRAFLSAVDGLRLRTPLAVEWKGPQQPPGYDFLPADLRIDHVFLISCKYLSKVLANPSPPHLFERALAIRGGRATSDWYMTVAEDAYRQFYGLVRAHLLSEVALPMNLDDLTPVMREEIKRHCARTWPGELLEPYKTFSAEVSHRSAATWSAAVPTLPDRELLLWRILRLNSAPYFILGSSSSDTLRLRVATPWDWRQKFTLLGFEIEGVEAAQPRVAWEAQVRRKADNTTSTVKGHVEVRWSHGRFCGYPEAKLYLDTPHAEVPGYFTLV